MENSVSTEIKLDAIKAPDLNDDELLCIDNEVSTLIECYRNNRQEINRLTFECVASISAGEEYSEQLAKKKGLRRFLGVFTGSNKKVQDIVNKNQSAAQYASQVMLMKLAEQNLMSFELIAAVNNRLNSCINDIEGEINEIYSKMIAFFKKSSSRIIQIENRLDKMERNINLLNWLNTIEYQTFNNIEYRDLDNYAKIVCLVRDFYDITKADWNISDLLLLKSAMNEIQLNPNFCIDCIDFITHLYFHFDLRGHFFKDTEFQSIPDPEYFPIYSIIKRIETYENEDVYVVETVLKALNERNIATDKNQTIIELTKNYLAKEINFHSNYYIGAYDLLLELLFGFLQLEKEEIIIKKTDNSVLSIAPISLESKYSYASSLFKEGKLIEAEPLLKELSDCGHGEANALLYWIEYDKENNNMRELKAADWATKGFQQGDVISTMLYALFVEIDPTKKHQICQDILPILESLAVQGNVFAQNTMALVYINNVLGNPDYVLALHYFWQAAEKGFYRAIWGVALRYLYGQGVEIDLNKVLFWLKKMKPFPQYLYKISEVANKLYENNNYDLSAPLLKEYNEMTGKGLVDLAIIFYHGAGVEKDYEKTLELLEKAISANERIGHAYCILGMMYRDGTGVIQNYNKAFEFFNMSSIYLDKIGLYYLGECYFNGSGTNVDLKIAEEKYRQSAEQNYQPAVEKLKTYFSL